MTDLTKTIQALRSQMRTWWAYETGETLDNGTAVAWEVFFERGEPPYDGEIKVTDLPTDAVLKCLEVAVAALEYVQFVHIEKLMKAIPGDEIQAWSIEHNAARAKDAQAEIARLLEGNMKKDVDPSQDSSTKGSV